MSRKYTPATFQPTVRPDWGGVLSYIPNDEKATILECIIKYPSLDCNSRFWLETIKPDLDLQYETFKQQCEAKSRGVRNRWGKTSITPVKDKNKISNTNVIVPEGIGIGEGIEEKEGKRIKNNKYGELKNVLLTQEQYETLTRKYPNLDMAIEKLDTWLGTSGSKNRNKNHFAYFKANSWVWENLPKGEFKTQNTKPNTLPADIDLYEGKYFDFKLNKVVATKEDNPDWSKYNRETGTFDL